MSNNKNFILKDENSSKATSNETKLPKINFSTFLFSLNSSALVHLGVIEEPDAGVKTKNLIIAKQTIDTIDMLKDKTKGNLTKEEEMLVDNILHDLRILYVKEKV